MSKLPADWQFGYCTNVHAGTDVDSVLENLKQFAGPVKNLVSPDRSLGIGLWFSESCLREVFERERVGEVKNVLDQIGLCPFTFNGFPFGDFHQAVVKQQVYQPTWADQPRLEYTLKLAELQSQLLPEGATGSISTLPLGWPTDGFAQTWNPGDEETVAQAANQLRRCAEALFRLYDSTGRKIRLAIEPEPGCLIDNAVGAVEFFERFLATGSSLGDDRIREYIGICHDICHSAVQFEPQRTALELYAQHEVDVVKVQVSSAIEIDLENPELDEREIEEARGQLVGFSEDRYLHQTNVRSNGVVTFFEDLPMALNGWDSRGNWRVHFHVPLFAKRFGLIGTTQSDVVDCLQVIQETHPETSHFEIETYAWNVLPETYRNETLSDGIARELNWFLEAGSVD